MSIWRDMRWMLAIYLLTQEKFQENFKNPNQRKIKLQQKKWLKIKRKSRNIKLRKKQLRKTIKNLRNKKRKVSLTTMPL
jgi:hypothetical protein